jgi:hypothetical protein
MSSLNQIILVPTAPAGNEPISIIGNEKKQKWFCQNNQFKIK